MKTTNISLVQINPILGNFAANTNKILQIAQQFPDNLLILPYGALTGYPLLDLATRSDFTEQAAAALQNLAKQLKTGALLLTNADNQCYLVTPQQITVVDLDPQRPYHFYWQEVSFYLITDVTKIPEQLTAHLLLQLDATPFTTDYHQQSAQLLASITQKHQHPLLYLNLLGGADSLVFAGNASYYNANGEQIGKLASFHEALLQITCSLNMTQQLQTLLLKKIELTSTLPTFFTEFDAIDESGLTYQALMLGLRDYFYKNGFHKAILGVSGGIDSALTLAIAYDALGPAVLHTLYLPSSCSSQLSQQIVNKQTQFTGVTHTTINIDTSVDALTAALPAWSDLTNSITEANLKARTRALLLMAYANHEQALLLTTGNKSEAAVGYATLYGDMAGGLDLLQDLYKKDVYGLANFRNQLSPIIPSEAITRAPTAELLPGQKDENDLPNYTILDEILQRYLEYGESYQEIVSAGFAPAIVQHVLQLLQRNEYKRQQAAPGIKVSHHAFTCDHHFPLTSQFKITNK